jgi:hypothetical protein
LKVSGDREEDDDDGVICVVWLSLLIIVFVHFMARVSLGFVGIIFSFHMRVFYVI